MSDKSDDTGQKPAMSEGEVETGDVEQENEGETESDGHHAASRAAPETAPEAVAEAPTQIAPAVAAASLDEPRGGPIGPAGALVAERPLPSEPDLNETAVFRRPGGDVFLVAHDLTAAGRQGPIFTGVTLTAGLGQLVAVTGDGGQGRSSLLLALSGRFGADSGTLRVDGQIKPREIRRRFTIAQAGPPIRFEEYHTVAACIAETIAVSCKTATRANINAWLDRLAVTVDTGDTFGFLSRIDQIRFAIACAAACRTPAIVVDDADTGLNGSGSERVFEALRTVADAGQLVLAACTRHDPPADTIIDLRAAHHEGHRRNGENQ